MKNKYFILIALYCLASKLSLASMVQSNMLPIVANSTFADTKLQYQETQQIESYHVSDHIKNWLGNHGLFAGSSLAIVIGVYFLVNKAARFWAEYSVQRKKEFDEFEQLFVLPSEATEQDFVEYMDALPVSPNLEEAENEAFYFEKSNIWAILAAIEIRKRSDSLYLKNYQESAHTVLANWFYIVVEEWMLKFPESMVIDSLELEIQKLYSAH